MTESLFAGPREKRYRFTRPRDCRRKRTRRNIILAGSVSRGDRSYRHFIKEKIILDSKFGAPRPCSSGVREREIGVTGASPNRTGDGCRKTANGHSPQQQRGGAGGPARENKIFLPSGLFGWPNRTDVAGIRGLHAGFHKEFLRSDSSRGCQVLSNENSMLQRGL